MSLVTRLRARIKGQTSGNELQSSQATKYTATVRRFGSRKLLVATCLLLSSVSDSVAHTVSIGYDAVGGGIFDVWYGTYHAAT